ncbi:sulfotransferase family protein [Salininema proteolyticum]|uniref:Sulfotransferase family protein n=1 Tax=Salininema proteolyticum TaxID=1607685 RepID=A0ABV8U4M8_9ACTN
MRRVAPWVGAANTVTAFATARQMKRHDAVFDRMVAKAEAESGGRAADHPDFIASYRLLLGHFAGVDDLSTLGWKAMVDDLQRRITNYLRVERICAENPAILEEPVESPVFVVGLPRTATTLAHKILVVPEENRGPLMWELIYTDRSDIDPALKAKRIKSTARMARLAGKASPMWNLIHPMDAHQPEECVFALPHGPQFYTRARVPGYLEWLKTHDFALDYRFLKKVLQVLQWGRPRTRWILKSPFHLYNLDKVLEVFGDATVLWTHRDPMTVLGSWCSLVETGMALHNRRWDPEQIGADWLRLLSEGVGAARDVRSTASAGRFVDVGYHSLSADPHREMPKLFARLGMTWTEHEERNLAEVVAGPGTRRAHEYDLTHYGLDDSAVDEAFGDYGRLGFLR